MIEVKNVSKKYGNTYAVRNVNFDVQDGEIVGFLGRNGAGKTTTMNMITGFIEPSRGQIIVNGIDVDSKPKKVKKLIGYMPEGTPLYSDLTVKEFISYMADLKCVPHKKRKEAIEKAIMQTGLDKVRNRLTRNLSRGFKQRVSLAGALVGNPEILILDEPTVGLDPKQVKEIRELIKSFRNEHTVILSSHILTEVSQICEKVIIIDKGEIIAVDTPENLEKSVQTKQVYVVTIEDTENKFEEVFKDYDQIKNIEKIKENEDNTFVYQIELKENLSDDKEFRKEFAIKCAENNILNLGISKEEASLEDAFIQLIENRQEFSNEEINKMQYEKELEELREEKQEKKERKEFVKEKREELKEQKKLEKQEKKKEKDQEKNEEQDEDKTEENKEDQENHEDEGGEE